MKKYIKQSITLSLLLSFLYANQAQAVSISYSDKTQKTSLILDFKAGTNLPFNFGINGGLQIMPSYSSLVGSLTNTGTGDERASILTTGEINLLYNINLFDAKTIVGEFNPTISPYLGYKHYFSYTATGGLSTSQLEPTSVTSNIGGINYGLRFSTNLPLGFQVFAEGGATSLLKGSWNQSNPSNSGAVDGNSLLLPTASVGASFNLLNVLTLHAGYNLRYIPDIRTTSTPLSNDSKALVHSLDVGLSFLFFSI